MLFFGFDGRCSCKDEATLSFPLAPGKPFQNDVFFLLKVTGIIAAAAEKEEERR